MAILPHRNVHLYAFDVYSFSLLSLFLLHNHSSFVISPPNSVVSPRQYLNFWPIFSCFLKFARVIIRDMKDLSSAKLVKEPVVMLYIARSSWLEHSSCIFFEFKSWIACVMRLGSHAWVEKRQIKVVLLCLGVKFRKVYLEWQVFMCVLKVTIWVKNSI